MTDKVTGYLLVVIGLIIILFSGFSVYQVFTAKEKPVDLFHFDGISLNLSSLLGSGEGLSSEQQAALEKQKSQIKPQEIVSAQLLNESSNLAAHIFLMGFIASIGYKVASLGVQFVRPIIVKVRESKETPLVVKAG
jgi:hypothetical protein